MASEGSEVDPQPEKAEPKFPAVASYGPCTVTDLKVGDKKKWCTCGLTKTAPWCDGSHKHTGFHSLKFTVDKDQSRHAICNCKHTMTPPYCDGTHTNLPEVVNERQKKCGKKDGHKPECKLCTNCGWVPDF